jgi:hypothetical protein
VKQRTKARYVILASEVSEFFIAFVASINDGTALCFELCDEFLRPPLLSDRIHVCDGVWDMLPREGVTVKIFQE